MKVRKRTEDEVCSSVVEREEPGNTVPEVSMFCGFSDHVWS